MKHKFDFVKASLDRIRARNLYRYLQESKVEGSQITIKGKKLINLCSNDYLGIVVNHISTNQLQSSSRLVGGNDLSFRNLEGKLAYHKLQESALLFPTGYMANLGTISPLAQKGDLIFSDELNHASIIEACKLSDARISVYKHNSIEDLERKLKQKAKRKFIITEGIFSMDGDLANLKDIASVSYKNNAILILDDAHGDFVLGSDGRGTADHFGVAKKIDVYVSSLSKALGAFGGYVATKRHVIDLIINKSRPFIYTSALPNFIVELGLKRFVSDREKQRRKLWKNIGMMHKGLKSFGYETSSSSQIIPIIIGKEKTAMQFGKYLFENGIFAQPIRYPTVKIDLARIRISITAWLSENQIERSLGVLESAGKKFKIF